ncbi:hypothetical protein PBI_DRMANHATTAN_31 [Arthrobacter phage DrManhattan]|uniref:DUF7455 domain-containing protein n=2 Tax=Manhattanvirus drmanhattan TaxID=2734250 RepID=A0A3G2KFN5_9CAUD|nr:hypothetical protein HOU48_gp31 [Arthrobacter phage DrManhattan]AYN57751.1 hypothetical protein PBI_DRMANHATTAN_31 [Arthrobacter phage DrManhattan]QHB36613.1 hypothetical protein SEA_ADOLIN_31 [Arthrobacter phage Adolin]
MNIPVETTPTEPTKVLVKTSNLAPATLTAADRCDHGSTPGARSSCGARAYVAVMLSVHREGLLPLYFCAHHYAELEETLREKAVVTVDERWNLTESVKAQKADVPQYLNTVSRGGI